MENGLILALKAISFLRSLRWARKTATSGLALTLLPLCCDCFRLRYEAPYKGSEPHGISVSSQSRYLTSVHSASVFSL